MYIDLISALCINVQCFAFIKLVVNDQAGLTIISFTLAGVKAVICYQSPSLVEHYSSAALSDLKERFGEKNVCFVQCDVTKDEEFINLFDEAEKFFKVDCVDILANNAGINTNFGWRKCMEVNIMAVMNVTEIALERMKKAGKPGQIINTASLGNIY